MIQATLVFSALDGTVPYDAHEFSIPPNGLEIGLEKSPQHIGSFLKVGAFAFVVHNFISIELIVIDDLQLTFINIFPSRYAWRIACWSCG